MTTLTISLPDSLKKFVVRQVKTRGYGNVSEYFRGLLRTAQEHDENKRLEALLLASLDDPRSDIEVNPGFWKELRAETARVIAKRRKPR